MADDVSDGTGIDWGAIEQGSFAEIAGTLWLVMALLRQEELRRDQAVRNRAEHPRQDRVSMMGIYAA